MPNCIVQDRACERINTDSNLTACLLITWVWPVKVICGQRSWCQKKDHI